MKVNINIPEHKDLFCKIYSGGREKIWPIWETCDMLAMQYGYDSYEAMLSKGRYIDFDEEDLFFDDHGTYKPYKQ